MTCIARRIVHGLALAALTLALAACGRNDPAALIESARTALAKADIATATIQLKNALQKAPDNAEARFLLARTLLQAGDARGAETEVRKAIELKYPVDAAYPVLGRALLARGEYQKTVALGNTKLSDPKAQADLDASVALAQLGLGNVDAAGKSAAAARAAMPDEPHVIMVSAQVAAARNDLPEALRLIDASLAKNPADLDALAFKAQATAAQGDREGAIKLLDQAVSAHPDAVSARSALVSLLLSTNHLEQAEPHVATLRQKAPNDVRTVYAEGLLAFAKKDPAKTLEATQKILAVAPDHLPATMLSGLAQLQVGSYAAAEDAFNRVIARAPEEPNARRALALAYIRTGRARQALDLLEPLLRADSRDPVVWRAAGEAALASGNMTLASGYFERAGTLDKGNVGTQVRLAQVRLATGETARAFSDLETLAAGDKTQSEADLAIVSGHLRRREFDAALAAADKLVAKQPDNPASYSVRGSVQLARRDLAGARASFEKALALDTKQYNAAFNLAMIDVREGKAAAARARYEQLLAKDPSSEDLLLAQADLDVMTGGNVDEARRLVDGAVAAHPQSTRARLAQIVMASRQGDPKGTLSVAEAAAAALPGDQQIADALGAAQLGAGNANQAIGTFQRAAEASPQNPVPLLRLAEAQVAQKDLQGAIVSTRKAVALQPGNARGWLLLGKLLLATNQADQALAEARKLQKDMPDKALGYAFEGELWTLQRKNDEAIKAYRQAMSKEAAPAVAARLNQILVSAGRNDESKTLVATWTRDHPKDPTLYVEAGQIAQTHNDVKGALTQYKAALDIDPDNVIVLNNVAWLLNQTRDPAAREYAERAYRIAPFNANVMDTLGWTLVSGNDVARGTALLRMASNLAPGDAEIRLHLGTAQARAGDKTGARATLQPLTRLDAKSPTRAEAEKALSTL
jgi:putative PEP-CTERM system TPR-repeat lipoprotein